jgi:hypothetical protein
MLRLSYANVTATLALFLALGGTSVAATNLISGSKIKKASIPADRMKPHALGAGQINVAGLGTVPNAAHAVTADSAGSAASATEAAHAARAGDADTVGGLAPAAFMRAQRVQVGNAKTYEAPAQVFFTSPLGFRLETDGIAGFDQSVVLRNTGPGDLGVVGTASVGIIKAGATQKITAGNGYFGAASQAEARFIVQRSDAPTEEAFVSCYFPQAGTGAIEALCTAVQTG